MKKLPLPRFDVKAAVDLCASGITIVERAKVLIDALPTIQAAEAVYKFLAPTGDLFTIESTVDVTKQLSGQLMGTIYSSHFMRAGAPSRALYDSIRSAPAHGICPLCGQRVVASVDHYLPQSHHPVFNLTPANLVPACSDCNKNKLAKVALKMEQQTLHPYFDDLGDQRWLIADIGETTPPAITYRVLSPADWSSVLSQRVQHHFEVMRLAELYAAQAASELADISYGLQEVGNSGGEVAVRTHLYDEFQSRKARDPNSWKTALYEGLCCSNWFCRQGFRLVQ